MSYTIQRSAVALAGPSACGSAVHNVVRCERLSGRPVDQENVMPTANIIGAITLFVDDVERSKAWYQHVFDQPVVHEDANSAVIAFGNTVINLLHRPEADGLIAPALVAAGNAGAVLQLTIGVDDVDAVHAELLGKAVEILNGPQDRPWGQRTVCFADPDGNPWEFAQSIG